MPSQGRLGRPLVFFSGADGPPHATNQRGPVPNRSSGVLPPDRRRSLTSQSPVPITSGPPCTISLQDPEANGIGIVTVKKVARVKLERRIGDVRALALFGSFDSQ